MMETNSLFEDFPEAEGTLGYELLKGIFLLADRPQTSSLRVVVAKDAHSFVELGNFLFGYIEVYLATQKSKEVLGEQVGKDDAKLATLRRELAEEKGQRASLEGKFASLETKKGGLFVEKKALVVEKKKMENELAAAKVNSREVFLKSDDFSQFLIKRWE